MWCEIRLKGRLSGSWSNWFGGLEIVQLERNETIIHGNLPDQTAIIGMVDRIHALNLQIISVTLRHDDPDAPSA